MMTKFLTGAAVAALLALAPATASAQQLYESVTGQQMNDILTEMGLRGTLGTDNVGDPMITGAIDGINYTLLFYSCNAAAPKQCLELQFHGEFSFNQPVTLEMINTYNTNNRFGQAFLDSAGRVNLDMSATLEGGVTRQHIIEVIHWWQNALTKFEGTLLNPTPQ